MKRIRIMRTMDDEWMMDDEYDDEVDEDDDNDDDDDKIMKMTS